MASHPMMSKRWLINYVLIFLVVVFSYIGNKYNVQPGYQEGNRISQMKAQDINQLSIKTADQTIRLHKSATRWQIEDPIHWYANNIAVERIIGIVNSQTDSRLPNNEIDISTLGLQFPSAILTLNQTEFVFGTTNNIGNRRYVLIENTVFLIDDRHLPFITQGLTGLLDRRLLPSALSVKNINSGAQVFSRETQDNWQSLEARHIQAYQSGTTPQQKIITTLDNEGQIEFYLLSITPEIVIARSDLGLQYHFEKNSYYQLLGSDENQ
ncbi:MAG: DUF4340 domain-containing protein [Gammaproteobacteria bacterium]|nr:DUF4340 domain-containing protein [Gammaproteobacteria bacterium]